jgi:sRNA-binding protein
VRAALLAAVLGACGPIVYVDQVTNHAQSSVDAASAADCARLAPYWYTRATLLLHLAREEAARADFQGANHFGHLADQAAIEALRQVKQDKAAAP